MTDLTIQPDFNEMEDEESGDWEANGHGEVQQRQESFIWWALSLLWLPNLARYWFASGVDNLHAKIQQQQGQIRHQQRQLSEQLARIQALEKEKLDLTVEKNDALTRLSQMISVKLRDNNPNIVDLNDQLRPNKLAELYSELYDNEWTEAFNVLETKFTEPQTISFLLDIIMESFTFTQTLVSETWQVVNKWYLDERFLWNLQTNKALKDGLKIKVQDLSGEIEDRFRLHIDTICGNQQLSVLLREKPIVSYMAECVRLTLVMNATDPPVVLMAPRWVPCQTRCRVSVPAVANCNQGLFTGAGDCNGTATGSVHADNMSDQKMETEPSEYDMYNYAKQATPVNPAHVEVNVELGTNASPQPSVKPRLRADKKSFKEYTKTGTYARYTVWPAVFLHKDGPLLGRGVFQGTNEQLGGENEELWAWMK